MKNNIFKKTIGWSIIGIWFVLWVANMSHDFFVQYGWNTLWLTPVTLILFICFIATLQWLID